MHFFYSSPRGLLRFLQLSTSSHLDQQGVDIPAIDQKEKEERRVVVPYHRDSNVN